MEKTIQQRALCSVHVTKYYLGDQTKKNEKGRECSMYWAEKSCIQAFGGKTLEEETT